MNTLASIRIVKLLLILALFIPSLLFLSMRPLDLGHDLDAYEDLYTAAIRGDYLVEPIYTVISVAAHELKINFRGVIIIYALLSFLLKLLSFQRITGSLRFFWFFYVLYFFSFYWLYEISQLRASLMLSIAPFIFLKNPTWKRVAIFTTSLMSHLSALPFGTTIFKHSRVLIFLLVFIIVFFSSISLNITNILLSPILEKYGGNNTLSTLNYLAHPFPITTALFIYALIKNSYANYGDIDKSGLTKTLTLTLFAFFFFLAIESRTAAFRIIELSNYLVFFFSFAIWRINHKWIFLIISFISTGSFVLMSLLAEVPIIDTSILFQILHN